MRFLRWAGSKARMLQAYDLYLPKQIQGRYIEPMCGAATLAFEWQSRWLGGICIGDENVELMQVYNWLRHAGELVLQHLSIMSDIYSRRADEEGRRDMYEEQREIYNERKDGARVLSPEDAARFIFLNRTGFNGLHRVNRQGLYNVPFGKLAHLPNKLLPAVQAAVSVLQRPDLQLYMQDYRWVLQVAKPGDLVYFDPPFDGTFTAYTKGSFDTDDQTDLRDVVVELSDRGIAVFLANSDTALIRDLYSDFGMVQLQSRRSMSCKGDGRGDVPELLIYNGEKC